MNVLLRRSYPAASPPKRIVQLIKFLSHVPMPEELIDKDPEMFRSSSKEVEKKIFDFSQEMGFNVCYRENYLLLSNMGLLKKDYEKGTYALTELGKEAAYYIQNNNTQALNALLFYCLMQIKTPKYFQEFVQSREALSSKIFSRRKLIDFIAEVIKVPSKQLKTDLRHVTSWCEYLNIIYPTGSNDEMVIDAGNIMYYLFSAITRFLNEKIFILTSESSLGSSYDYEKEVLQPLVDALALRTERIKVDDMIQFVLSMEENVGKISRFRHEHGTKWILKVMMPKNLVPPSYAVIKRICSIFIV